VGRRFKEVWLDKWTTVVGVVGDVKSHGLTGKTEPEVYRPFLQLPTRDMALVVRTHNDPMTVAALLREAVASVDAQVPVSEIRTAEQIISNSVAEPRFTMLLLASFATLALALAAVGVYGVISYSVSRRTREIGVRVAMGAMRADVLHLILRQALTLAGVGAVVGVAAAFAVTRVLRSLLYEVSTTDALTMVSVPLLLVGVALAAAYVPARRAARVDPSSALLGE
jgi:putative ABC transport system permease protein